MQLIGMLDSPYVRRVAVALIAAKVPFSHRPISLFRHMDEFSNLNPLLKAPTLVTGEGTALMDLNVILDYLAGAYPRIAALTPTEASRRLRAFRSTGIALTVMEKAVQRHYERALRPADKRHQPWIDRVMSQLTAGLAALDAELPTQAGSAVSSASPTSPSLAPSASSEACFRTSPIRAAFRTWPPFAGAPRRFRRSWRPPRRTALPQKPISQTNEARPLAGKTEESRV